MTDGTTVTIETFLNASPTNVLPIGTPAPFEPPQISTSLSFYDKHIDNHLDLRAVVDAPNLVDDLASTVQTWLKRPQATLPSTEGDLGFPDEEYRRAMLSISDYSGQSTSAVYNFGTRAFCGTVASTIYYSAHLAQWCDVFARSRINKSIENYFLEDFSCASVGNKQNPSSGWHNLPEDAQKVIDQAQENTPAACVYLFLEDSPAAEKLLRNMDRLESLSSHELAPRCSTIGFSGPPPVAFGDTSNSNAVGRLIVGSIRSDEEAKTPTQAFFEDNQERPKNKNRRKTQAWDFTSGFPSITLPPLSDAPNPDIISEDDLPAVMVRRAWARAVETNSSFILFHCSSYERIGIRDRETQTLYLSRLIAVNEQHQVPGYYAIQTGLYLSLLEDIIERAATKVNPSKGQQLPSTNHPSTLRVRQMIARDLAKRDLALISFGYHPLNSPAPAAFTRWKPEPKDPNLFQTKYLASGYFTVTLTSEIARGNTGIVHNGLLQVLKAKNAVRKMDTVSKIDVVVKISFSEAQRRRLQKEGSIYQGLSESIPEGIPRVYGLFEDTDSNALMMIMDRVGECLLTLFPAAFAEHKRAVSPDQCHKFKELLDKIHEAGYLHRDIRAENPCLNEKGEVFFIDFDRARKPDEPITEEQKQSEHTALACVLEGERFELLSASSSQLQRELEQERLLHEQYEEEDAEDFDNGSGNLEDLDDEDGDLSFLR